MKQHDPPKGQFKTKFGTVFNYEARGNSFRLSLPEGRKIAVKGKTFNKISLNVIPENTSHWKNDPENLKMSDVHIKRVELMHEPTKPQLDGIYKTITDDFNTLWSNDIFLPKQYRAYRRFGAVNALLSERNTLTESITTALNRIKDINIQLTEYL